GLIGCYFGDAGAGDVLLVALHVELRLLGERGDVLGRERVRIRTLQVVRLGPDQIGERAPLALLLRGTHGLRGQQGGALVHDVWLVDDAEVVAVLRAQLVDSAPRAPAVRTIEVHRHHHRDLRVGRTERGARTERDRVRGRGIGLAARLPRRL